MAGKGSRGGQRAEGYLRKETKGKRKMEKE